jgi:hypothetical protein
LLVSCSKYNYSLWNFSHRLSRRRCHLCNLRPILDQFRPHDVHSIRRLFQGLCI